MLSSSPIPPEVGLALSIIARSIVDFPDDVKLETLDTGHETVFHLRVHPKDLGKLIGTQGRTARALRILLGACAKKFRHPISLDIEMND